MVRVRDLGRPPGPVDLSVLEEHRKVDLPGPFRGAGGPPYWEPGTVVTWHWGRSADVLRVVRDDERGLVAWLPAGSEVLVPVPVDGKGLRERSLAERVVLEYEMHVRSWRGDGILRIAPAGKPWSLWYFWNDEGGFEGHYVNIELVHERPVSGEPRVHTRDLTLDLWIEAGAGRLGRLAQGRGRARRRRRGRPLHTRAGRGYPRDRRAGALRARSPEVVAAGRGLGVLPPAARVGRAARASGPPAGCRGPRPRLTSR